MDNPGVYNLAAIGVTAPLTAARQTPIASLEGMKSVSLVATFRYGSGGATFSAVVQTTFDGGTTWIDIARFEFTTASNTKYANVTTEESVDIASYAALAGGDAARHGLLGSQLAVALTSTGSYVDPTFFSLQASVR